MKFWTKINECSIQLQKNFQTFKFSFGIFTAIFRFCGNEFIKGLTLNFLTWNFNTMSVVRYCNYDPKISKIARLFDRLLLVLRFLTRFYTLRNYVNIEYSDFSVISKIIIVKYWNFERIFIYVVYNYKKIFNLLNLVLGYS